LELGPYAAHFGSDVRFGQPRDEFVFPAATLEQRCGVGGVAGEAVESPWCATWANWSHMSRRISGQVRHAIRDLMLLGECTAPRLAALFAVHRFTLHRHLQDHGTSFAQLLDEERDTLARRLLANTDMQLGDVARALGSRHRPALTRPSCAGRASRPAPCAPASGAGPGSPCSVIDLGQ
jgi:AraC-like DNA-binding protein